jgi:hypothetical protein
MIALVVRSSRWRVAAGLIAVLALAVALPDAAVHRLWIAAGIGALLAPWLVLGRERLRRRQGWRNAAATALARRRLVLAEFAGPAVVVVAGALVAARGAWAPSVALSAWALAVIAGADALDRRRDAPGAAWLGCVFGSTLLWTAPWWLARWFGRTALAPHLASDSVGLHPAGTALAAANLPTLQDPYFYEWTLSGVVEALPTPWFRGAALFGIMAAVALSLAIRAAGRIDSRRMT